VQWRIPRGGSAISIILVRRVRTSGARLRSFVTHWERRSFAADLMWISITSGFKLEPPAASLALLRSRYLQ